MTKKLEKLKEVNLQLTNVLNELETLMFIKNIDGSNKKEIKEEQPKVVLELK
jgi:hypothetical protein